MRGGCGGQAQCASAAGGGEGGSVGLVHFSILSSLSHLYGIGVLRDNELNLEVDEACHPCQCYHTGLCPLARMLPTLDLSWEKKAVRRKRNKNPLWSPSTRDFAARNAVSQHG